MHARRLAAPAALLVTLAAAAPAVADTGHGAASHTAVVVGSAGSAARALAGAPGSASGSKQNTWSGSSTSRLDQAAADVQAARRRWAAYGAVPDATAEAAASAATAATTIYVAITTGLCTSETGNDGSAAHPYCSVQDAVDAAAPGDTVSIAGEGVTGYATSGLIIQKSDLTLVGTGSAGTVISGTVQLDGVTGVTLSGLILGQDIQIADSSQVVIDSDEFVGLQKAAAVTIDGTSSDVTVSRSMMNAQSTAGTAISVAAGARGIDIASNAFAPFDDGAVSANGVAGIDVVGNTIQRGCGGGVILTGATTGAYIENNVLEDANPDVDQSWIGGLKAGCATSGTAWSPDITVDATAAAGTTSDYNDFFSWGSDDTAAYSWDGTVYQTAAALATAAAQGAHDTVDTVESSAIDPNPFGWGDTIQAALQPGSAAIGSAYAAAPGALSSDLYGVTPYTDRGAVALDSDDVSVSATVTPWVYDDLDSALTLEVAPTGSGTYPISHYSVAWGDGSTNADTTHTYAQAGTYSVTVTATDTHGRSASTTIKAAVAGSDYTPYGPVRILDTRNGTGAARGAVAAHGTVSLKVAGAGASSTAGPIPAGITAVVMNVTVVTPTRNGVLTVYPDEGPKGQKQTAPNTSNLNFSTGQTVPNLVTVPVGPDGVVDLYNNAPGTTQVLADVVGYFQQKAAGQYVSVTPHRILDTRNGLGAGVRTSISAGGSVTLGVADIGQQSADPNDVATVTAVAVNLTAINGSANGVITAYPTGEALPTASNVNYPAHTNIADMAIVPVGTGGRITFHNNSSGTVDLAADINGYFTTTTGFPATVNPGSAPTFQPSAYLPMAAPYRWIDTRSGNALAGGFAYNYSFLDDEFVDGVVLNATVVGPTSNGFLSLYPGSAQFSPPDVSNINFKAGQNVPNMAIVSPGYVDFVVNPGYYIAATFNEKGTANLVADVFGVFEYE